MRSRRHPEPAIDRLAQLEHATLLAAHREDLHAEDLHDVLVPGLSPDVGGLLCPPFALLEAAVEKGTQGAERVDTPPALGLPEPRREPARRAPPFISTIPAATHAGPLRLQPIRHSPTALTNMDEP